MRYSLTDRYKWIVRYEREPLDNVQTRVASMESLARCRRISRQQPNLSAGQTKGVENEACLNEACLKNRQRRR